MALATDAPWQAIAAAALLGTERQPFQIPSISGNLGTCLSQLGNHSNESALLSAVGIVSIHQRVGWLPEVRSVTQVESCSSDDLPRCSPRAARCLQQILEGQFPHLLSEWLEKAAIAGQRVPEMLLSLLLDKGRQQRELRAAILPVLGQRGQWLAAQNPDWNYAVALTTEADWETGTSSARLLYLQDLRSHNPDHARELLQSTWKQETASDRVKFLETLRIGLSIADEPFLEDGLGDRSKEVRRVAADLLASLPQSHLCHRMSQRLVSFVRFKKAVGRLYAFDVSLPETCDAEMQRDGIEPKPKSAMGERSWWLQQIISATPLTFWEQPEPIGLVELIKIAQINEWKDVFIEGWRSAAQRQCNQKWARIFLDYSRDISSYDLQQLLNVLIPEERQAYAIDLIQSQGDDVKENYVWRVIGELAQQSYPWQNGLTHLVLTLIEHYSSANNVTWHWEAKEILKTIPLRISPTFLPQVVTLRKAAEKSSCPVSIQLFLETLQFRQEMMQAFGMGDRG